MSKYNIFQVNVLVDLWKVLLYAECARRLVIGDVHPPWIALVVLCHLTLCYSSKAKAKFSVLFAPDLSPFMGENRQLRSSDFITRFLEQFCVDSTTEPEQWPNRLHRWACEILIKRTVIEP